MYRITNVYLGLQGLLQVEGLTTSPSRKARQIWWQGAMSLTVCSSRCKEKAQKVERIAAWTITKVPKELKSVEKT